MVRYPLRTWTPERVELLRSLVELGLHDPQIAERMQLSISAVNSKRLALGMKTSRKAGRPRIVDREKLEAVRQRISAGETVREVAADLGVQPASLYMRLRLAAAESHNVS